jgi:hypothetical protein
MNYLLHHLLEAVRCDVLRRRVGHTSLSQRGDPLGHLPLHGEVECREQPPVSQEAEDQRSRDVVRDIAHHPDSPPVRVVAKRRREIEPKGIGDLDAEGGMGTQSLRQGGRQLPIQLHRQDSGPAPKQGLGQHPRAGPDFHHHASGADAGRIHDGIAQPRVDQEVLSPAGARTKATRCQQGPRPGQERRRGQERPGHLTAGPEAAACLR